MKKILLICLSLLFSNFIKAGFITNIQEISVSNNGTKISLRQDCEYNEYREFILKNNSDINIKIFTYTKELDLESEPEAGFAYKYKKEELILEKNKCTRIFLVPYKFITCNETEAWEITVFNI